MKLASRRAIVRITANFLPVFRLLRGAKRMQTVDYVCGGSTSHTADKSSTSSDCAHVCRTDSESRALVYAMIAPSEIGEQLIADGAHRSGEIIDAHAIADQRGKVAATHGALGQRRYVDGEEIHRHAAGDGAAPAGHDDLGCGLALGGTCRPQEAVRIPNRHHCNAALPAGGKGGAIAYGLALADRAHLDDPALELDRRTHGVLAPWGRVDTVERHSRTNQVAIHGAAEEYSGRI